MTNENEIQSEQIESPLRVIVAAVVVAILLCAFALVATGDEDVKPSELVAPLGVPLAAAVDLSTAEEETESWPTPDRSRVRSGGVARAVAQALRGSAPDAAVLDLRTLAQESIFKDWRTFSASLNGESNRNPTLVASGEDSGGNRLYRVLLGGRQLGTIAVERAGKDWNIVSLDVAETNFERVQEELLFREAMSRLDDD